MKTELDKILESIRNRIELDKSSACNKAYTDGFDDFVEQVSNDEFPMSPEDENEYFTDVLSLMKAGDTSFFYVEEFERYCAGWNNAKLFIQKQRAKE